MPRNGIGQEMCESFRKELEHLINCHSMESGSDTPDFVLAQYLIDCLIAFDRAEKARESWYGQTPISPTVEDPRASVGAEGAGGQESA
jgi:hypothetical protein